MASMFPYRRDDGHSFNHQSDRLTHYLKAQKAGGMPHYFYYESKEECERAAQGFKTHSTHIGKVTKTNDKMV